MHGAAYVLMEAAKCLWDSIAAPISYICNPTKNLKSLEDELQRLMARSVDVSNQVEVEEVGQGGERTKQVDLWLKKVKQLEVESRRLIQEGESYEDSKCLVWCCPSDSCSSYKLGKDVTQLLNDVKEHQAEGDKLGFNVPIIKKPCQVPEMSVEKTVGQDSMLLQVWEWLQVKDIGIIGLYGMGGAGKTTLLKRINEEFRHKSHGFDVVLWVVVSKQVNLDKIRESVSSDLGIGNDVWRSLPNDDARAAQLCKVLNRKKFVLLIDDIWERLNVAEIGIPHPNPKNGSKIVFTTRFEQVCGEMEAKKSLRVECLLPKQASELFQEKVGHTTLDLHPDIPRFAELIVQECKGLPLALITIGRAMATKKTVPEWEHAVRVLRSYPARFSKMEDKVYRLLEFSYQSLDPTLQQCFLYCALFPEDYNISKDHLIELWMAEGFLFDTNDTYGARLEGESVIGSLKSTCLLEEGQSEHFVKMHDVIRDMALWIARERGKEENKIIVEEKDVCIFRWKEAERVSLQGNGISVDHATELSTCSKLVSLLINETDLETLPERFFNSMSVLKVLDMIWNGRFRELPTGVGNLTNLQYLNLSGTDIKELPVEMKSLTSLLYLLLDDTEDLVDIPKELISSFTSLKVLRKSGEKCYVDERGLVEGLEGLNQLNELSLSVHTTFGVKKLLVSPNLQQRITRLTLTINYLSDSPTIDIPASSLREISHLNSLELRLCDSLESINIYEDIPRHVNDRLSRGSEFTNLHQAKIWDCNKLKNLSWLIYAPNLQVLCVYQCSSLEKFIDEDIPRHVNDRLSRGSEFTNLHGVLISDCNKLKNLSWLIFAPNLQNLSVYHCNSLEKIIDEDVVQHIDENAIARLFSSLTRLYLHQLPKLRCVHNQTLSSPSLREITVRNCPELKKLPFDANSVRHSLMFVESTNSQWSELEWDDEDAKAFFTSKFRSVNY